MLRDIFDGRCSAVQTPHSTCFIVLGECIISSTSALLSDTEYRASSPLDNTPCTFCHIENDARAHSEVEEGSAILSIESLLSLSTTFSPFSPFSLFNPLVSLSLSYPSSLPLPFTDFPGAILSSSWLVLYSPYVLSNVRCIISKASEEFNERSTCR